ncbi:unnamed protein product, partial [Bubo scandiacus]
NWFVKKLCMQSLEEGELCSTQGKGSFYRVGLFCKHPTHWFCPKKDFLAISRQKSQVGISVHN